MRGWRGFFAFITSILFIFAPMAFGVKLVSSETIKTQKELTKSFYLKNKVPVTYRKIEHSDIVQLNFAFSYSSAHQPSDKKVITEILLSTMTKAAKGWSKEKIYKTLEKYSASIHCSTYGTEYSYCSLTTINDYWDKLLPLFSAVIRSPMLKKEDMKQAIDMAASSYMRRVQKPESYVNDIINRKFYPAGHPYKFTSKEALEQLKSVKVDDLVSLHKKIANASLHKVVIVGSVPKKKVKKDLDHFFGDMARKPVDVLKVKPPEFKLDSAFAFEHREIPTAYIRLKFNTPGLLGKDSLATQLMFAILSEELEKEIRTRRSLSYAVYSYQIRYQIGIGVVVASTSKPKETLEVVGQVIERLRNNLYTDNELDNYKVGFATRYFLTQEDHTSLSFAILRDIHYFGSTKNMYEMPAKLELVTPKDVNRVANGYLHNFRIGVIFDKDKFKEEWALNLIKKNKK